MQAQSRAAMHAHKALEGEEQKRGGVEKLHEVSARVEFVFGVVDQSPPGPVSDKSISGPSIGLPLASLMILTHGR